ncbi:MAG: hypothetical protein V4664_02305 [Patescibacteria group bacterium]
MKGSSYLEGFSKLNQESPRVGHKEVLDALIQLKKEGINDLQDMENKDVLRAFELFKLWAAETEAEENLQKKLIGYLDQYAIGLEADWVNNPSELREMDKNISQQLDQVGDDNVPDFRERVKYYRDKIKEKLG